MEKIPGLPEKIIFREPNVLNQGQFFLMKPMFVMDGHNVPRSGRCDSMTYSVVPVSANTNYANQGLGFGDYSPYLGMTLSLHHISAQSVFLDASPLFCFFYIKWATPGLDNRFIHAPEIQEGLHPGSMWAGLSIAELFKNMREWSFMVDKPFNSKHPMAIYSKLVFDTLNPPQSILQEIDAMPDMHLARFLRGDKNHRSYVDGFPQMSDEMTAWFKIQLEKYPRKSTSEYLQEIIL